MLIPFRLDENKRTAIVRLLVPFFIESLSARKKAPPEDHREQVKELSTWSILSISISRGATCSHCTGNSDLREIKKPQIVDGILSFSQTHYSSIWNARYRCNNVCDCWPYAFRCKRLEHFLYRKKKMFILCKGTFYILSSPTILEHRNSGWHAHSSSQNTLSAACMSVCTDQSAQERETCIST
jgi:hypothetical protein